MTTEPMHTAVTLRTSDGRFVGRAEVPDFHSPAEVLVWGTRTFVLTPVRQTETLVYVEAMAFYVVLPVNHDEVG